MTVAAAPEGTIEEVDEDFDFRGYDPADVIEPGPYYAERIAAANESAARLLRLAAAPRGGVTTFEFADELRSTYGLDAPRATADTERFLDSALKTGALSIRPDATSDLRFGVVRPWLMRLHSLVTFSARTRRSRRSFHDPTSRSVATSASRAHLFASIGMLLPVFVLGCFLIPQQIPSVAAAAPLLVLLLGGYVAFSVGAGALHELAHFWTASALGVRTDAVYHDGVRAGILRQRGSMPRDILITLAGPLAAVGALAVALAVLLGPAADHTYSRVLVVACLLPLALNLACLIPPSVDGATLWRAVRGRR